MIGDRLGRSFGCYAFVSHKAFGLYRQDSRIRFSTLAADMTTRTGPTTYGFNATADRDAFDFTQNVHPVIAIWDAGGIDTYLYWHATVDNDPANRRLRAMIEAAAREA